MQIQPAISDSSQTNNWLVVSTHLKNISQNGNLPQIGVKIKNVWNHHLDNLQPELFSLVPEPLDNTAVISVSALMHNGSKWRYEMSRCKHKGLRGWNWWNSLISFIVHHSSSCIIIHHNSPPFITMNHHHQNSITHLFNGIHIDYTPYNATSETPWAPCSCMWPTLWCLGPTWWTFPRTAGRRGVRGPGNMATFHDGHAHT